MKCLFFMGIARANRLGKVVQFVLLHFFYFNHIHNYLSRIKYLLYTKLLMLDFVAIIHG